MHGAFITTPTALVLRPTDVAARAALQACVVRGEIFTGVAQHRERQHCRTRQSSKLPNVFM